MDGESRANASGGSERFRRIVRQQGEVEGIGDPMDNPTTVKEAEKMIADLARYRDRYVFLRAHLAARKWNDTPFEEFKPEYEKYIGTERFDVVIDNAIRKAKETNE